MKRMFVGNLPADASEESVSEWFTKFGTLCSVHLNRDVFTGKCRGFGLIEMEGHEARAAIVGLDGKTFDHKPMRVRFEDPTKSKHKRRR